MRTVHTVRGDGGADVMLCIDWAVVVVLIGIVVAVVAIGLAVVYL